MNSRVEDIAQSLVRSMECVQLPPCVCRKVLAAALFTTAVALSFTANAASCAALASLHIEHLRIVSALEYPAGKADFKLDAASYGSSMSVDPATLPGLCRVVAESTPAPGSTIGIELWLPTKGWTGRLVEVGNGGLAGVIYYTNMLPQLSQGSAVVATDTGHKETSDANHKVNVEWAKNYESMVDFGYRAVHQANTAAKVLAEAYYGKAVSYSYFTGCSTGGRQAAMEAERYPSDFDGILMGAPALDWSSVHDAMLWETRQNAVDQSHFIPKDKLAVVRAAVMKACDANDGLKDGLIQNPLSCHLDAAAIQCKEGDGADCLTSGQVDTLRKLYSGPTSPSGDRLYYGAVPGSEEEIWPNLAPVTADDVFVNLSISTFEAINGVSGAQAFDWKTFDFADQMRKSKANVGPIVDATDTDIRAFLLHGKMLAYTGWNDPFVKPERVIAYYKGVEDLVGQRKAAESIRLFMVPNMGHCAGGDGPNDIGQFAPLAARSPADPEHNALMALQAWVERGRAPDQIVATRYEKSGSAFKATISRPLCPYPQVARFNGSGDVGDARNFKCAME